MTPYKTVVLFVFLSLMGLAVVSQFSIDLQPNYSLPTLTISFTLPDASPETVEQEATAPLENVLSQITNIKKIYSVSGYNQGTIEITFDKQADIDFKKFEITSLVRQIYPKLNPKISYPQLEQRARQAEGKKVLLLYRINAKVAPYQIKKTTNDLFVSELAQLKGIKEVQVTGAEDLQISIDYDLNKLRQFGVSPDIISRQILQTFASSFPGQIKLATGQRLALKVENKFYDLKQLGEVQIPAGNEYVKLSYLAKIYVEETAPNQYFRINGLNSVTLGIYADNEINRIATASQTKDKIEELKQHLPNGFQLLLDYDDTEFLQKEMNKNYLRSGLALTILLGFILVAYRKWQHLVILSTGILTTLCLTALSAYLLGISIHLYTIAGITISFGMMVDNAIVMLDQLDRKNNRAVFKAILGATLTTVMALLLVLLLPEEDRQNLTEFSLIVALALGCSIFVATFFVPAAYRLLFGKAATVKKKHSIGSLRKQVLIFSHYFKSISFAARYKKTMALLLVLSFGIPLFMLPAKWEGQEWYNRTIGSDYYQETIRPHSDKWLGGALRLFVRNVYERSGYRDSEKTKLYVNATLPYGNTLEDMNRVILGMESYLQTVSGIDKFVSAVYTGQHGSIIILFEEEQEKGALPYQLKSRLIARSLDWGGVEWNIYGVGQGFSNSMGESLPNFKVQLKGYNYAELERQAQQLADELLKHKRIQKVNTNERLNWNEKSAEQLVLHISSVQQNGLPISTASVAASLKEKANSRAPSFQLALQQKEMPVYLRASDGDSFSTFAIMEDYLRADSTYYRLASTATLNKERTTNAIHKEDRQYIRMVGFDYYGSSLFGNKYLDEVLARQKPLLPAGYKAEKISWPFSWAKAKRQYGLLLLLILGIYIIGTILFESFKQPLYIVLAIPISFIGLFLSFAVFDFYFDQGGYAAFILLGGLVVNSVVFILNDFNQLKRKTNRGFVKVVTAKIKPITLTLLSTCLGLVPFLIGGQNEVFWFSLAVGTIGGLLLSLIFIGFILPILLSKKSSD
ncbi:MAG: efflux RND transporter permease subunit [Chryseotalea sp. WA131a]|nr:MAG: efflux RND transporter permease subunit [Chryseotalea sp. WA131a]